jgi:hypothetical protein
MEIFNAMLIITSNNWKVNEYLFVPGTVGKIFTAAFLTLAAFGLQLPNLIKG